MTNIEEGASAAEILKQNPSRSSGTTGTYSSCRIVQPVPPSTSIHVLLIGIYACHAAGLTELSATMHREQ